MFQKGLLEGEARLSGAHFGGRVVKGKVDNVSVKSNTHTALHQCQAGLHLLEFRFLVQK
jgi:hypothetical protein